jgi:uncharacterized protein (DUF2147 family)
MLAAIGLWPLLPTNAHAGVPQGTWIIDARAAIEIFDCGGPACGRIVWLRSARDLQGQSRRDKNNPDPTLRQRPLCGMVVLWGLMPSGRDRWKDGWFYNPDDGRTYNVYASLKSTDVLTARIYLGVPLFGNTKTLARMPVGNSDGWC